MDEKKLKAFTAELDKGLKTEADINQASGGDIKPGFGIGPSLRHFAVPVHQSDERYDIVLNLVVSHLLPDFELSGCSDLCYSAIVILFVNKID